MAARWALHGLVVSLVLLLPSMPRAQGDPGKTVVVATPADPQHFNPGITTASHTHAVADSLFNGLVALARDASPLPDLAQSWAIEDGGRVYRFKLAGNVRWHDGTALTPADVAFTFREILLKYHARTKASLAPLIDAIETPDNETVVFRLKRPYPALLQQLDVTEAPILPKHVFAGTDPNTNTANLNPIGSGPFKLDSYRRDDQAVLIRNPEYFKPGLPRIDRLAFRVIPDERTATLAIAKGEIDYLRDISGPDLVSLRQNPDIVLDQVTSGPGGGNCIMTVGFNLERKILADVRVRRAFALAVDRNRMQRDVIFGQGRVADAPISSGIGFAHASGVLAPFKRDVEAAKKLLDEAGMTPGDGGVRLKIDMVHFPQFSRFSEAMRQDLSEIGVRLTPRPLDRAATIDTVFTARDFDSTLISYCNGLDPEIGVRRMYVSSNIGKVPFSNAAAYRDPEVDRLFDEAATLTEPAGRGAVYRTIQEILARDLPYWWLVETDFTVANRVGLEGFTSWRGQFAEQARVKP
jgi:peptide/nickel transport system substrate-binding protein